MKKLSILALIFSIYLLPASAHAVCPVCTVAVGGGVGLARYFGLDDIISGVWVGAFLLLMAYWVQVWLTKIKKNFTGSLIVCVALMYALTFVPLRYTIIFAVHGHTVLGIDRLLFGSMVGSILMFICEVGNNLSKEYRKGKVSFKFQKVIVPVSVLLIASGILYILSKKFIL